MTESGLSNSQMGLLYSSSSVFGAIFDIFLSRYLKTTSYIRMYFYTIVLGLLFPLFIFFGSSILFFIVAMMIWGLYYNLWSFGRYDFVTVEGNPNNHASSFGIVSTFRDIGYLIGPLIASRTVFSSDNNSGLFITVFSMILALVSLLFMTNIVKTSENTGNLYNKRDLHIERSMKMELSLWRIVAIKMWPILIVGIFLGILSATYWTIVPIIHTIAPQLEGFEGIILVAMIAPSIFVNLTVGSFTSRFGQKRTAYWGLLLSGLILLSVGYIENPYVIILMIFVSSMFSAICYPSLSGAVADYLDESKSYDNEILSVQDFTDNIGYIIGPLFAGLMLDFVGDLRVFTYIAIAGILLAVLLLIMSPKEIDFHDKSIK
jgi:MFS family permease